MSTFVTIIQISASKFDVFFFNAVSSTRLYPQTNKKGVCVHILESTTENDKYAFNLCSQLNNNF